MTNTASRDAFVNEIASFLTSAERLIENFLSSVGWTKEHLQKHKSNYVTCPFNSEHKMPGTSLERHAEICKWVKAGYSKESMEEEVPSSKFFYENASAVVTIIVDKTLQHQILQSQTIQESSVSAVLPNQSEDSASEAKVHLTSTERCAIYDYVVAQGKAANVKHTFQLEDLKMMPLDKGMNDEPQKEKSRLEILAEQRDYKRRRQTYRAKNVHITKKSYTEVLQNIIENQMKAFNPNWQDNENSNPTSTSNSPTHKEQKYEVRKEERSSVTRSPGKRSRSRERHRSRRSRSREGDKYRRYEKSTSSRSNSRQSRSDSYDKTKESDERFRRDRSRDRSRTHHKKSHKKHKHHWHSSSGED